MSRLLEVRPERRVRERQKVEVRSRQGRQDKAGGYLCLCDGEGGVGGSRRRRRTCLEVRKKGSQLF